MYFLEWLSDKFLQGGDRGQAELFLSKDDCIDIRKARTWSNLSHASNRYGVSLVNFALLELCPSAWYRLSGYAPHSKNGKINGIETSCDATVVSRSAFTRLNQNATPQVLKHVLKAGSGRLSKHLHLLCFNLICLTEGSICFVGGCIWVRH